MANSGYARQNLRGRMAADIRLLTCKVRGRRSGEAAEGTEKRSFSAVPLDRRVRSAMLHVAADESS